MKRKITFMMLAIGMLSITSCKAFSKREQVCIDSVLQNSMQAILEKYLPEYGSKDGEIEKGSKEEVDGRNWISLRLQNSFMIL